MSPTHPLNRLSVPQRTLSDHLAKMPSLAILLNADLFKGFTVPQDCGHGTRGTGMIVIKVDKGTGE